MAALSDIFSQEFLQLKTEEIITPIAENGIFTFQNALREDAIDRIIEETGPMEVSVNVNALTPVQTETQVFFTNFLAKSKTAYDLVTSDTTINVCDSLMKTYSIAGKRIYITKPGMNMQWHCDVEKRCKSPDDVDGTVFIFYLTDVNDGEFQYVEKSHMLGQNFVGGKDMDAKIEAEFRDRIRSVKGKRGLCVIYNGRTFHRAKPMKPGSPPRMSLFYQVNRNITSGETTLLDAGFLDNLDDKRRMLLGIGHPAVIPTFPKTNLGKMAGADLLQLKNRIEFAYQTKAVRGGYQRLRSISSRLVRALFRFPA